MIVGHVVPDAVTIWADAFARQAEMMANKDKGGKSSKTAATSTAKEKKAAKRDKKQAKDLIQRSTK